MKKLNYDILYNLRTLSFFFLSLTLCISFYLGENSSGGAKYDHSVTQEFIILFSDNLENAYDVYRPSVNPHLPFYYLILGKLSNFVDLNILRFLYLLISITLPLIFYKILKLTFKNQNKNILFFISLIIFLSPYFRSSAIWLTNDNLTLIFFSLSLYYFYKSERFKNNNQFYSILCLLFLILATYLRQNFILFLIFYIYFLFINSNFRNLLILFIINSLLSLPILHYFFFHGHIDYYLSNDQVINAKYSLNLLIFLNIILFYLLPFLISKKIFKKIIYKFKNNLKEILLLIIFILIMNYFITDYTIFLHGFGGGVFYKVFVNLLDQPIIFVFTAIISSILILCFFDKKIENYVLFVIIFFLYPLQILYQKYYDPLFLILMFSALTFKYQIHKDFFNSKFLLLPMIYFSSFYFFALYYYN